MALSAYTQASKLVDFVISPSGWAGVRAKLKLISNTHHAQEVAIAAGETVGIAAGSAVIGSVTVTSLPDLQFDPGTPLLVAHPIAAADSVHTHQLLIAAPGEGLSIYITDEFYSSDGTAAMTIQLEEDPAGTPVNVGCKRYIPASGGACPSYCGFIKLAANKALGFTNTGQSNAGIDVHYKIQA